MAKPDRSVFIALLKRLGAERDEDALAAARELHRAMVESGLSWDDLLIPDSETPGSDADDNDEEDDTDDDEIENDEEEEEEDADAAAPRAPTENLDEAARTVDRLLALKSLSDETRDELTGFKHDLAEGRLSPMDVRYIAALARRLGA